MGSRCRWRTRPEQRRTVDSRFLDSKHRPTLAQTFQNVAFGGRHYTNLIAHFEGDYTYSYTFDGQAGYLDHALVTPSLLAQATGVTHSYINSDEPDLLDYDTGFRPDAQDALYGPNAYRSSDHDALVVGLNVSGTLTVADKGIANTQITKALPVPKPQPRAPTPPSASAPGPAPARTPTSGTATPRSSCRNDLTEIVVVAPCCYASLVRIRGRSYAH